MKAVKPSKPAGMVAALAVVILWMVPVLRAVSFYRLAQAQYDGSMDAASDVSFSKSIIFCYTLCIIAALTFAFLVWRRPGSALIVPGALLVIAALNVIWARPGEVIVFIPAPAAVISTLASAAALAIAAIILFVTRRKEM